MALARFLSFVLIFFAVTCVISVESSLNQKTNVVYTRYVRRRPVKYAKNRYIHEVMEIFHTKRRPPPYAFLNDENLTRFVRCDHDPTLPGCDESGVTTTTVKAERSTTTTRATSTPRTTTTTTSPSTTTTTGSPWIDTTTTTSTTTTTPAAPTTTTQIPTTTPSTTPSITSTTTLTSIAALPEATTTEELPLLPDIDDENDEDYDEEDDSPSTNNEDEKATNGEYQDYLDYSAKEAEGDYLTEDNAVDETAAPDADNNETNDIVESAALTQETSTTAKPKSLFEWF